MGKINWGRVILGGIVAGIVWDIIDFVIDGVILAPRWTADMAALGHPTFTLHQIVASNMLGIVGGITFLWLYAAIRPRYGAGPRTAIVAAVWFWIICFLIPNIGFMWIPRLFSHHLVVYTTAGNLVEIVAAALAGASLYKESA